MTDTITSLTERFNFEKNEYLTCQDAKIQNLEKQQLKSFDFYNKKNLLLLFSFFFISSTIFTYYLLDKKYFSEEEKRIDKKFFIISLYVMICHVSYIGLVLYFYRSISSL